MPKLGLGPEQEAAILQKAVEYERSCPVVRFQLGKHPITLNAPSGNCARRILTWFRKEPETIDWIAGIPEDGLLFDVGANIGLYTVWAALTRGVKVCSFEPEAGNFAALNQNLRSNGLTGRCWAFCVGLSDIAGFGRMQVQSGPVGVSGHQVQVTGGTRFVLPGDPAAQGISTTTLDRLVYEEGLPCPTHLKIDVDGLEYAVIQGAERLLGNPRLSSIMVEVMVDNDRHRQAVERIVAAGFAKDEAMERAARSRSGSTGNILFSRPPGPG